MKRTLNQENSVRSETPRLAAPGSAVRSVTLALATLTTGLVAGLFYGYAISVNPALGEQPDASYVATENAITEKIVNPLFFASFLGAPLFLLAALAAHYSRRPRTGRFRLIALASVLYIVGGFLLTMVVNAPMSYQLAAVDPEAPARVLAEARDAYEDPWNFWHGVRTVFSTLAFVALIGACLSQEAHAPRSESRVR